MVDLAHQSAIANTYSLYQPFKYRQNSWCVGKKSDLTTPTKAFSQPLTRSFWAGHGGLFLSRGNLRNFLIYNGRDVAVTASTTGLPLSTPTPAASSTQHVTTSTATAIRIRTAATVAALSTASIRYAPFSLDPAQPPRGGWQGKGRGLHKPARTLAHVQRI